MNRINSASFSARQPKPRSAGTATRSKPSGRAIPGALSSSPKLPIAWLASGGNLDRRGAELRPAAGVAFLPIDSVRTLAAWHDADADRHVRLYTHFPAMDVAGAVSIKPPPARRNGKASESQASNATYAFLPFQGFWDAI